MWTPSNKFSELINLVDKESFSVENCSKCTFVESARSEQDIGLSALLLLKAALSPDSSPLLSAAGSPSELTPSDWSPTLSPSCTASTLSFMPDSCGGFLKEDVCLLLPEIYDCDSNLLFSPIESVLSATSCSSDCGLKHPLTSAAIHDNEPCLSVPPGYQAPTDKGYKRSEANPSRCSVSTDCDSNTDRQEASAAMCGKMGDCKSCLQICTQEDVQLLYDAVSSLYTDQILPGVFNLKGRLQEMDCSEFVKCHFVSLYETLPDVYEVTYDPSQKQTCVFLKNRPEKFERWVNATDTNDPYPEEMWEAFTDYLRTLMQNADDTVFQFARGRYGFSQQLHKMMLPFFPSLSLGQYCHVVQLAISKRRLLAYENNVLKPVATCVSSTNAMLGVPDQERLGKDCIVDIYELQFYIAQLLQLYPNGFNLSTMKRKIKQRFNRELCQTVFHCTKLMDLMTLPEIAKICAIDTDNRHTKLVPARWDTSRSINARTEFHPFDGFNSMPPMFPRITVTNPARRFSSTQAERCPEAVRVDGEGRLQTGTRDTSQSHQYAWSAFSLALPPQV